MSKRRNLGLLYGRSVVCPAVYEVRCSALVQVAAGLTKFVCLRKPLTISSGLSMG